MTTATQQGRQLRLTVDGIDEPFLIDPLSAKRGKYLTERFIRASLGQMTQAEAEEIFIESLGASNYSRMSGYYVDEYHPGGRYAQTWTPEGAVIRDPGDDETITAKFIAREAVGDEPELEGEPIRQEESEALALAAFYWQTVVGMEAVDAFLNEGGGTNGSLKALTLLQIRLGLSRQPLSSSPVMENLIQEASSKATPAIQNSSASVRLPANKRGFLPKRAHSRR